MSEEVTLQRVSAAIHDILSDEIPEFNWKQEVIGRGYPKTITGYIGCDSLNYGPMTKEDDRATASYTIEIIAPNPKENKYSTGPIEDYAMQVRECLKKNYRLDGWALNSRVTRITFGIPSGQPDIGAAILQFEVEIENE